MKTAISIPDPLFKRAERLAKRQRRSRSEFYASALSSYVQNFDGAEITRKINEVCARVDTALDPALSAAARRTFLRNEW